MRAHEELNALIETIASHDAGFYRTLWGDAREFASLPPVSREDFMRVPLSKRRYKAGKAIVKIVRDANGSFLSEWAPEDIREERYGAPSKRPMVYLSNPHESLEKGAWCHLNGMAALVGEREPEVAMIEAGQYEIDSLITDSANLAKLKPYLENRKEKLLTLSILDASFDMTTLRPYEQFAEQVRLVLALPEVGAFAESAPATYPRFGVMPNCIVEHGNEVLVTKVAHLVTPVIRYKLERILPIEWHV